MNIDRALIIRRESVDLSLQYAKECAESCDRNDLPYEFVSGIEFMTSDDAFAAAGVKRHTEYKGTVGHNNCHASHIKAWRRLIELDKCCVIFEHDVIVKGRISQIDIPDMALVTLGFRVQESRFYEPISEYMNLLPLERAVGVHACAMTPRTAQWLIDKYESEGVRENLDKSLMMDRTIGLPLYVADPPQVVCVPR